MLKNKKILLIFLIFVAFLFIFNNSVFATIGVAGNSKINDTGWRYRGLLIDTWNYMLSYLDSNGLYLEDYNYFVTCGTPGNIDRADVFLFPKTNTSYILKVSSEDLSYWSNCIHFCGSMTGIWHDEVIDRELHDYLGSNRPTLVVCNDIVTTDNSFTFITRSYEDVSFFQRPPVIVVEREKTLSEIIQESNPEILLMETIQLLPLIIVVVVSLVGLRKGLVILSRILHKA